jgi:hypothetical protein
MKPNRFEGTKYCLSASDNCKFLMLKKNCDTKIVFYLKDSEEKKIWRSKPMRVKSVDTDDDDEKKTSILKNNYAEPLVQKIGRYQYNNNKPKETYTFSALNEACKSKTFGDGNFKISQPSKKEKKIICNPSIKEIETEFETSKSLSEDEMLDDVFLESEKKSIDKTLVDNRIVEPQVTHEKVTETKSKKRHTVDLTYENESKTTIDSNKSSPRKKKKGNFL